MKVTVLFSVLESIQSDEDKCIMAESEVRTDREAEKDEIKIYDEVYDYLFNSSYPEGASKAEKCVIRKRAKKFQLVDGVLHYKENVNGGHQRLRQVLIAQ